MISVVMCTFNGAPFVEAQLESLAGQTCRLGELLVCDDGSQDRTEALVRAACARLGLPLRWIGPEARPLGPRANFERGFRAATGARIAFCDQDDVWYPHKLARTAAALDAGALAAFTDGDVADASATPTGAGLWDTVGFRPEHRAKASLLPVLLQRNVVTGATLVVDAALRDRLLPFPGAGMHDAWVGLVAALGRGLAALPERTFAYRQHGANAVGAHAPEARLRDRLSPEAAARARADFCADLALTDRALALPLAPDDARLLLARRAFLAFRTRLHPSRTQRAGGILRHLAGGDYARFSRNGWKSALRDLLVAHP